MIEITIRIKGPVQARRLAAQLRALAAIDPDRGQAKMYRGAAKRLERIPRPYSTTRPPRPAHVELDEEAIERAVQGLMPLPPLSPAEARIACFRLTRRGCSAPDIAERVGATPRTVIRWRAEDRQAATR